MKIVCEDEIGYQHLKGNPSVHCNTPRQHQPSVALLLIWLIVSHSCTTRCVFSFNPSFDSFAGGSADKSQIPNVVLLGRNARYTSSLTLNSSTLCLQTKPKSKRLSDLLYQQLDGQPHSKLPSSVGVTGDKAFTLNAVAFIC